MEWVYIQGYGWRQCQDTPRDGWYGETPHLDVYLGSREEALNHGVQQLTVWKGRQAMEIKCEPIKFVLAVDSAGNALIADTQKPEGYDVFAGQWAEDNQIENLPKEPGLYNCKAQPRWDSLDSTSDLGEMFFDIISAVKIARFDFGEASIQRGDSAASDMERKVMQ
jgi:hypothetical protein